MHLLVFFLASSSLTEISIPPSLGPHGLAIIVEIQRRHTHDASINLVRIEPSQSIQSIFTTYNDDPDHHVSSCFFGPCCHAPFFSDEIQPPGSSVIALT